MIRKDNWYVKLKKEMYYSANLKFEWGVHDCFQFTARCIFAQTDNDIRVHIRGYSTEIGAGRAVKQWGGENLRESFSLFMEWLKMKELPVNLAQRGNPIAYDDPDNGFALGITGLDNRYGIFTSRDQGLMKIPVLDCITCWGFE